jgi:polar amino acid transport system substrate-binding protein
MLNRLTLALFFVSFFSGANEQNVSFSLATAELPPYVYLDENKQPKGIFIDMLGKVQNETSIQINILVLPWARAMNEVKNGHIDALLPTLLSEQRKEFLVFPTLPFFTFSDSVLIKRTEDNFVFKDLGSIDKEKVIGKTRLVMIDDEFDALVKLGKLSVYETAKLDEALLMLAQRKIDLVASDGAIALSTIKNLGMEKHFTLYPLRENNEASYIAFSKQFALVHDINSIMEIIMRYQDNSEQ